MEATLLITTYKRPKLLRKSLRRLCCVTPPAEVIVVNDGAEDETEEVCREFEDRLPIRYLYHHNPDRTICSFARNVGLREASHDVIVTAEPEMLFLSDVIAQIRDLHAESPDRVFTAGTVLHQGQMVNLPEHVVEQGSIEGLDIYDYKVGQGMSPERVMRTKGWIAPYVAAYPRWALFAVRGWDEQFPAQWGWDDIDLLSRLARLGGLGMTPVRQTIAEEIQVMHQWHPQAPDQGREGTANEEYFLAKPFRHDSSSVEGIVANTGKDWGVLRTKPEGE